MTVETNEKIEKIIEIHRMIKDNNFTEYSKLIKYLLEMKNNYELLDCVITNTLHFKAFFASLRHIKKKQKKEKNVFGK